MNLTYRMKLTFIITLLAAGLSSVGMWAFYTVTYKMMVARMGKNLIDVGRLATVFFDHEDRQAIERLNLASEQEMQLSAEEINAIQPGEIRSSLPPRTIDRLHRREDFQRLVEKLRKIAHASFSNIVPGTEGLDFGKVDQYILDGAIGPYIGVAIKESPQKKVVKYLVSPGYAPTESGWPGNSIGNLAGSYFPSLDLFWL